MAIRNKAPHEVWDEAGTPKMLVTIEGLRQTGPNEFELSDVVPRNIDWASVAAALGFESGEVPDRLGDAISEAVWDYDIRELLAQRIKRR